jgi:hypothetical protein
VVIPRDWKATKQDLKWYDAMTKELDVLGKNKTWELVHLLAIRARTIVESAASYKPVTCHL